MAETPRAGFGSDLIVDMLRLCGIDYVALNPGATFRGLHDSLVNYGEDEPGIILCNHEEIAVAIAHGYARAAHKPMAAAVHDIVGLQHASMAIFNAWFDREPVLVLGGTGPMDTARRRPWIDWVHTALVQGNLVRDFVKWDDQPASPAAIPEAMLRAYRIAFTEPWGPVYLCFDADVQEQKLVEPVTVPASATPYGPPRPARANPTDIAEASAMLAEARFPVIVADFMGRHPEAVAYLGQLADVLAAPVLDKGGRLNILNTHPLDLTGAEEEMLSRADVILALDVPDLLHAVGKVNKGTRVTRRFPGSETKIIQVGLNELSIKGWSNDFYLPMPLALSILASPVVVLPDLIDAVRERLDGGASGAGSGEGAAERKLRLARQLELAGTHESMRAVWAREAAASAMAPIVPSRLALEIWDVLKGTDWVLANGTAYDWARRLWTWDDPRRYCGRMEPAGGLGFGLGASIGAALAHKGTGRIVVDLQPDGDFLFTPSALWTAAHHRIPLLIITVNNRSYFNDVGHQEFVALERGRPPENKVVGIDINDPAVDFAKVAQGMGVWAEGPIESVEALRPALRRALKEVQEGRPALVDVVIDGP